MDINTKLQLHTGRQMPILGLGSWQLSHDTAGIVSKALNMGYPMIDTSGDYGTQPGIAKGIKNSGVKRDDFYLVTKVEETDDAYSATKKNLEELQLGHVDLMLIHRPPQAGAGVELWEGLIRARKEGMTKDIGVSNYSEDQIQELFETTGTMPVVNQIEWSPFGWSKKILNYCKENHIIIQAYSPLTRQERLDDEELRDIAEKYNKSPAQLLIRWAIQMGVVPLPKANKLEHLQENIDVFDFELSSEDMELLCDKNEHYSSLSSKPVYELNRA